MLPGSNCNCCNPLSATSCTRSNCNMQLQHVADVAACTRSTGEVDGHREGHIVRPRKCPAWKQLSTQSSTRHACCATFHGSCCSRCCSTTIISTVSAVWGQPKGLVENSSYSELRCSNCALQKRSRYHARVYLLGASSSVRWTSSAVPCCRVLLQQLQKGFQGGKGCMAHFRDGIHCQRGYAGKHPASCFLSCVRLPCCHHGLQIKHA